MLIGETMLTLNPLASRREHRGLRLSFLETRRAEQVTMAMVVNTDDGAKAPAT